MVNASTIETSPRRHLFLGLIDTTFAVVAFSSPVTLALFFLLSPIIFLIFLGYFSRPVSFIRVWNSWPAQCLKYSFILVTLYFYVAVGSFPSLDTFSAEGFFDQETRYAFLQGGLTYAGFTFVILTAVAQIIFMVSAFFNLNTFFIVSRGGDAAANRSRTSSRALVYALAAIILLVGVFFLLAFFVTPELSG